MPLMLYPRLTAHLVAIVVAPMPEPAEANGEAEHGRVHVLAAHVGSAFEAVQVAIAYGAGYAHPVKQIQFDAHFRDGDKHSVVKIVEFQFVRIRPEIGIVAQANGTAAHLDRTDEVNGLARRKGIAYPKAAVSQRQAVIGFVISLNIKHFALAVKAQKGIFKNYAAAAARAVASVAFYLPITKRRAAKTAFYGRFFENSLFRLCMKGKCEKAQNKSRQ